jgi:hypothetical protein
LWFVGVCTVGVVELVDGGSVLAGTPLFDCGRFAVIAGSVGQLVEQFGCGLGVVEDAADRGLAGDRLSSGWAL